MSGKRKNDKGFRGIEHRREDDFGQWYSQVITKSEMIDYYAVSGCYILRPYSYSIWEQIQSFFDREIKDRGVQNAYFPMFVTERALSTEKDHIEGFAPEVAWVTRSGSTDLSEPIAIRPTSETIMYPAFQSWIRSHRDLPLRLNQWSNIVRWEFKHPMPFIRSREFLWQEGHSAFASPEDAKEEVVDILHLYKRVYEELLAVPVVEGRKSEKEKFAGGDYTLSVEAYLPIVGRGVQGATSHSLGQNFAKMFDITFENTDGGRSMVWQNSWGITTRSIGVMIIMHGDNKGLVLPPRVAPIQVVVVPIWSKKSAEEETEKVRAEASRILEVLRSVGVRVQLDDRVNVTPGWKYNHWEVRGVPIRLEIGPRDVAQRKAVLCFRDTGSKMSVVLDDISEKVKDELDTMQQRMFNKAKREIEAATYTWKEGDDWECVSSAFSAGKMCLIPWCQRRECEESIRTRTSFEDENEQSGAAKSLNIPFEQPDHDNESMKCVACGHDAKKYALFGRSY